MEELIAKRYIKAIKIGNDIETMKNVYTIFSTLSESFKDTKFKNIINNPHISKDQKSEILISAVKSAKSKEIDNLINLVVEHNRINIIPAMAEVLRKEVAQLTKTYSGVVYSDSEIDSKVLQDLSNGLSKRFDLTITLNYVKNDFDGVKVDVEDLGVEIDFSKSRINSQMIEHIVKAI